MKLPLSYSIGAFAKLTGVTERTLRYYDRKQLLSPSHRNEHGHRFYSEHDLLQLQQILTLKYLGFSLEEIAQQMSKEGEELQASLQEQHRLLLRKRQQLDRVITIIERMQGMAVGIEQIDRNLMLVLIYNLQHEEAQRAWFVEHISKEAADLFFLTHWEEERRLEMEQQLTNMLMQLVEFCKQGKDPKDEDVLAAARKSLPILFAVLEEAAEKFNVEEKTKLMEKALDPVLFPTTFLPEEEVFIGQVLEQVSEEYSFRSWWEDHDE
ncbi:MerR family transcriptional regulator [Paenibacillus yanchengensis]|uniref:MerR family transcriptional regulator n=1 Tax=Paenibacillus yanchengensis TaxID=2035833 RepID=A0ABW4YIP6_9BACL